MTNPTLRELVDMLPGEMRDDIQLTIDCMRSIGGADWMLENAFLGYLVRWLLERNCWPDRRLWDDDGPRRHKEYWVWQRTKMGGQKIAEGDTPLEAAVRAVGVVSSQGATAPG